MCSHYTALKKQEQMEKYFRARGIPLPANSDMWPKYQGVFVRRPAGQWQESYTMLTINADQDSLFQNYHQAGKEKRMVVILPEGAYQDWLTAPVADTHAKPPIGAHFCGFPRLCTCRDAPDQLYAARWMLAVLMAVLKMNAPREHAPAGNPFPTQAHRSRRETK
ncbi:hypothetical protein [Achromobacter sp. ACM01]|uniref:hypothetical protein n=1 Tax=Achromobacter sp. ACM01 TaxID=2769298 RepID=UPI001CE12EB4|nr:hypothetical protein [Achromobacter sp. ACM01]